jgi:hypothetical protein
MKREDWEPDFDDEPRLPGKSSLDLFRESCEAADAERRKRRPDGIIPWEEVERETQERFRREWEKTVTYRLVSVMR